MGRTRGKYIPKDKSKDQNPNYNLLLRRGWSPIYKGLLNGEKGVVQKLDSNVSVTHIFSMTRYVDGNPKYSRTVPYEYFP